MEDDNKLFGILVSILVMCTIVALSMFIYFEKLDNYKHLFTYTEQDIYCDNEYSISNPSDNIHFADPKTKIICLAHWDNDDNGELTYSEAAAVTDLEGAFTESEIEIFAELKYFSGLTSISKNSFYGCKSLKKIKLPKNISSIENSAFKECGQLSSIYLPSNITRIGSLAFWGCCKLREINIPHNVDCIEKATFSHCENLKQIVIGENVRSVGKGAFRYCYNLAHIYFKGTTPPKGADEMFEEIHDDYIMYVPLESLKDYRTTRHYKKHMFSIEPCNYRAHKDEEEERKFSEEIFRLLDSLYSN